MSILSVPITLRSLQRFRHIVAAFARHGFGHYVTRLKLRRYLPWRRRIKPDGKTPPLPQQEDRIGRRLVAICEELGPTFVKLGQLLSTRADVLPKKIIEDLESLQHDVGAFPAGQVREIVEEELGEPIDTLFTTFDDVPIASGSIAQTHRATLKGGEQVVLKIRRPGIESTTQLDMHILEWLARQAERHLPELRVYNPVALIQEFSQSLARELDLVNEGTVTQHICRFHADEPSIVIPEVNWDLTTSRVLTMTYIEGRDFNPAVRDDGETIQREKLARTLLESVVKEYMELGVFHADPHPGNLLITSPGRIALLDFGMSGRLDRTRCTALIILLMGSTHGHFDLVVDVLTALNSLGAETNIPLLKRDLAILVDKYKALPLKHLSLKQLFHEIMELARNHHVNLPRDFVLMGKSLVTVSGPCLMLDPEMNVTDVIKPQVHRALLGLASKENVAKELSLAVWHGGMLVKELPHQLRALLRKLERGEIHVQTELQGFEPFLKEMDRSSNRLSFSMVLAAIIIGSSIVFHAQIGPTWSGLPLLGLTGYILAGLLGLWLVVAILRSGKLS